MSNIFYAFRPVLRFSKIKKIVHRNKFYTATTVTNDVNGKDIFPFKYGGSHYEAQDYDNNFFHKPQCIPNLKELERQHNDKIILKEENKKNPLDCENEPWVTNNDRED